MFAAVGAVCGVSFALNAPVSAKTFSNFYLFGGSYSDAGTYLVANPAGKFVLNGQTFDQRRWTINPAPVWNEFIGSNYGLDIDANLVVDTSSDVNDPITRKNGGTNYAQGGAAVTGPGAYDYNTLSLKQQIDVYLKATGGRADPNALYSVEAGGNSIINAAIAVLRDPLKLRVEEAKIRASANTAADLALRLSNAGAEHILVFNTNNFADVPGTPDLRVADAFFQRNIEIYNGILLDRLLASGRDDFILVDGFGFFTELVDNGGAYGFDNTSDRACVVPTSPTPNDAIFCTLQTLNPGVDPDVYLWDGGLHPSAKGHLALSQYVQSILSAPGQYAVLAEVPLLMGQQTLGLVDQRSIGLRSAKTGLSAFAQGNIGNIDLDGTGPGIGAEGNDGGGHAGLEYVFSPDLLIGLMGGHNTGSFDYPGRTGGFDTSLTSGTAYAFAYLGQTYFRATASYGSIDYSDIERSFDLYKGRVTNYGDTDGSYAAASIKGGYEFELDRLTITPTAALTYQRIEVDGYSETGMDWAAFTFEDQTREAFFGSLGARVQTNISFVGIDILPWLGAAYHHDFDDGTRDIHAGINSAQGLHFSMPYDPNLEDWVTIDGGLRSQILGSADVMLAGGVRLGDDNAENIWSSLTVTVPLNWSASTEGS